MSEAARDVGVIGLGIMGSAIARNLQQAGFAVVGVDPDRAARERLATALDRVDESFCGLPARLVSCLPSAEALNQVCDGVIAESRRASSGLSDLIRSGGRPVLAETSTLPIADKRRARERLADAGIGMLDAPLSGTGAQALTRDLAVYASGEAADIELLRPVFQGFARTCHAVGEFGHGMRMKLVANLLVAIHNVATAEALLFAQGLGLDPARVVEVVGDGAGSSRMLQIRGPLMASRDWAQASMKVAVWDKDMTIITEALREIALPAPLFDACIPIYREALAQGHSLHDTASVYAVLERRAATTSG